MLGSLGFLLRAVGWNLWRWMCTWIQGREEKLAEVYSRNCLSPLLSAQALFLKLLLKYQESVPHKHLIPFFSIPQLFSFHPPTCSVRLSDIAASTLSKWDFRYRVTDRTNYEEGIPIAWAIRIRNILLMVLFECGQ